MLLRYVGLCCLSTGLCRPMAIIPISARGDAPGQWGHKPKAIIANLAHRDTSDPVVNGVNKNSLMNTFSGFSQQHYQVHSVEWLLLSCKHLVFMIFFASKCNGMLLGENFLLLTSTIILLSLFHIFWMSSSLILRR